MLGIYSEEHTIQFSNFRLAFSILWNKLGSRLCDKERKCGSFEKHWFRRWSGVAACLWERLTSFLPDPEVPSSRLAPDDREPWDSRRPLLPAKSKRDRKKGKPSVVSPDERPSWHGCTTLRCGGKKNKKTLTVVEVSQLSFLGTFAEAPVARPGEEHAFPPVSRLVATLVVQRSARFTLFVLLSHANRINSQWTRTESEQISVTQFLE